MDIVIALIKLLIPGIAAELLDKAVKAVQIIMAAFAGDEARREAELGGAIEELRAGQEPTILRKVFE